MTNAMEDPMGGIARRKLHVALVLDRSKSMMGVRIESLNEAVRTVLPALKEASEKNPQADVHVRILTFSSGASWQTPQWLPISEYGNAWHFEPLSADGITDLGAALDKITEELDPKKLGSYNYPPVLVLVTDGQPTDDWQSALKRFNSSPFGKKAGRTVRAAISIKADEPEVLAAFTGNPETVVEAENSSQLVAFIKWATVTLSKHSSQARSLSQPTSNGAAAPEPALPDLPLPPPAPPASADDDVF